MRKKTTSEFISDSIKVHGDKYDYSLVDYINVKTKIKIICKIHGVFEQSPNGHLCGRGCNECGMLNKFYNTEEFIEKSIKIHENRYDYTLVEYINYDTKVKIICKEHGIFKQKPKGHLNGQGCTECAKNSKFSNTVDFIKQSIEKYGEKYDYSLIEYVNNITDVKIKCPIHGLFKQKPTIHLRCNGCGCPKCSREKSKLSYSVFLENSINTHGNKFDYSLVELDGTKNKVKIKCATHGVFEQSPDNHMQGKGCPSCKESSGEREINDFLNKINITFIREYTFDDCKYKKLLLFDFYLPEYNMCIEYDGDQHYIVNEFFGGEKAFKETQIRDNIKNEHCKNNNIRLLRIRYDENIEEKLNELFQNFN